MSLITNEIEEFDGFHEVDVRDEENQKSLAPLPEQGVFDESFFGDFLEDITSLVRDYIVQFFQDKEMYCGGPVPRHMMLSDAYISLVMNTRIDKGVGLVYDAMENSGQYLGEAAAGDIPDDIRKVLQVLHECEQKGIPKPFATGILVMYMELVEGLEVLE